jgi:hypothetical protein
MGHISQAWTNLAPPSANFLTDCATDSLRLCGGSAYVLLSCMRLIAPQPMPSGHTVWSRRDKRAARVALRESDI